MSKAGITPLFTKSDLNRWFKILQEEANARMYVTLQAAGEMFVKYARESGQYDDHTGNLRSSIGYVIIEDGEIKSDSFALSDKGTDRVTGLNKAEKLAKNLANTYNTGMVLIGVAGMEYAVYVEAMENKDVITAANIKMEEWLRKSIQAVFDRA